MYNNYKWGSRGVCYINWMLRTKQQLLYTVVDILHLFTYTSLLKCW